MSTAREDILQRIRTALPGDPQNPAHSHAGIARHYDRTGTLSRRDCLELFIDRLVDYDTEIIQLDDEAGLPTAIASALQQDQEERIIVAPEFPAAWLPAAIHIIVDNDLSTAAINHAQAVITTCEAAVASTGTIFLVHQGTQGRRVITLLPDHHICLVRRDQVVELIPEALTAIAAKAALPITTISGPSATSDIEMTRIRGVHGPRRLTVILYGTN